MEKHLCWCTLCLASFGLTFGFNYLRHMTRLQKSLIYMLILDFFYDIISDVGSLEGVLHKNRIYI